MGKSRGWDRVRFAGAGRTPLETQDQHCVSGDRERIAERVQLSVVAEGSARARGCGGTLGRAAVRGLHVRDELQLFLRSRVQPMVSRRSNQRSMTATWRILQPS